MDALTNSRNQVELRIQVYLYTRHDDHAISSRMKPKSLKRIDLVWQGSDAGYPLFLWTEAQPERQVSFKTTPH